MKRASAVEPSPRSPARATSINRKNSSAVNLLSLHVAATMPSTLAELSFASDAISRAGRESCVPRDLPQLAASLLIARELYRLCPEAVTATDAGFEVCLNLIAG